MVSQRGVLNLFHTDSQRDAFARRGNAMQAARRRRRDCSTRARCARFCRWLDFDNARFPIMGGLLQRRGGTVAARRGRLGLRARGRPRSASTSSRTAKSPASASRTAAVMGVETTRGYIGAGAGRHRRAPATPSRVAALAGLRLPIESHVLQAFVSEGLKPTRCRASITFGAGPFLHQPVRQGRAGVRRRHRRLQLLCPARQPADGRGRVRGRRGADAVPRPAAHAALLGRHHGHVDGRLADHRPHAGGRPLSERGLVLRRLQGDAGVGLVLRAPARHGPAARSRRRLPARPLRAAAA